MIEILSLIIRITCSSNIRLKHLGECLANSNFTPERQKESLLELCILES